MLYLERTGNTISKNKISEDKQNWMNYLNRIADDRREKQIPYWPAYQKKAETEEDTGKMYDEYVKLE
jgi:hypothetical protein